MRKYRILAVIFFGLAGALSITFVSAPLNAAKAKISREEKVAQEVTKSFEEGEKYYLTKKYSQAYSCFSRVHQLDPAYRAKEVEAYLKLIGYKLGKTPKKVEKFEEKELPEKEVQIKKEEDWQVLVKGAEEAILAAGSLLDKVIKTEKLAEKDLLDARFSFAESEKAFEKKQYQEAKRLADKCRYLIEILLSQKEPPKKLLGKIGDTPVTLNLNNADLQESLKLIYDLTGANIVLSPGIKGKVTINVKDLPLREVLNVIVQSNNLQYIEKENVIRIMSKEEYEKSEEGLAKINKKAFPLHYAESTAIAKIVKDTLKIQSVTADPRTNSVLIDVASSSEADKIENLIQSLDLPVSQVLIEAKLIEVVLSDENSLGIDWEMASQVISEIEPTTTLTGPIFGRASSSLVPVSGVFSFAISNKRVNAVIVAVSKQGNAHALSQPRILTLDGKEAKIEIIEEVPFVSGVTVTSTTRGGVTTYSYSYTIETRSDIGITLTVTPRIQKDRSVNLHLDIKEIRIVDYLELPISAEAEAIGVRSRTPHTADRITTQDVVVWDGQTLILGGMISTRKSTIVSKVPFLGNIPLLGHLFKKTAYEDTRTELVIFLTPYVIRSFGEGKMLTNEEKEIEKQPSAGIIEKF